MNFHHLEEKFPCPQFIRDTNSISFYDSIVVFEKGAITPKRFSITGTNLIKFCRLNLDDPSLEITIKTCVATSRK